jgi:hypothetical protein
MQKSFLGFVLALLVLVTMSANASMRTQSGHLSIRIDPDTQLLVLSWTGKGILKEASEPDGKFRPVPKRGNQSFHIVDPRQKKAVYRLETANGPVYSGNVVGYVNLELPPGLSLIANPLYSQNHSNQVAYWWTDAPDGSQVLKYISGNGYEVSTFDGIDRAWSNPSLEVPLGEGFYFRNPSSQTITHTFVGEVLQGYLTNTLPAGYSMKGSLVPQSGSINSLHQIAGEPGDELRTLTNDLQGGPTENISTFSGEVNQWVPDLNLGVGQGFWMYKTRQQDWVRYFSVLD